MKKSLYLLLLLFTSSSIYAQQYAYDDFNRLTTVTYADGSQIIYEYDNLGNRIGYEVIAVKVFLDIKMMLGGAYDANDGLMRDDLRSAAHLPTEEPFTAAGYQHKGAQGGGEALPNAAALYAITGPQAIVDWVVVELRDKNDITNVLHTRSALVRRDGSVVDLDGVGLVGFFGVPADEYYIAVRHRNHLAIATENPIIVSAAATTFPLNFTNGSTETYGNNAQITMSDGILALIGGDANGDGQVNAVDLNIEWRMSNGQPFDYPQAKADLNLDGATNAVDANVIWRPGNSETSNIN